MRPTACLTTPTAPSRGWGPRLSLVGLLLLASCAANPLRIPPPPHALPSRVKQAPDAPGVVAESRPAAVPGGYDAPGPGELWRTGDSIAFSLEFDDCAKHEQFFLLVEVTDGVDPESKSKRASVKVTLLDFEGNEIGTAKRRWNPTTIIDSTHEIMTVYSDLVQAAASGESPEDLQAAIDDESKGPAFIATRKAWFNELKKNVAPKFVRDRLKEPAIGAALGGLSVLDLLMAALNPIEVLVDVNRVNDEQAALANFDDIPVPKPLRVPFVMTVGGTVYFRFAITVTAPEPPYALGGGILELAGVNEERGERRFLVKLVSAKRGPAPESRASPE